MSTHLSHPVSYFCSSYFFMVSLWDFYFVFVPETFRMLTCFVLKNACLNKWRKKFIKKQHEREHAWGFHFLSFFLFWPPTVKVQIELWTTTTIIIGQWMRFELTVENIKPQRNIQTENLYFWLKTSGSRINKTARKRKNVVKSSQWTFPVCVFVRILLSKQSFYS